MTENVQFLIDADYPNREVVDQFIKQVRTIKNELRTLRGQGNSLGALARQVQSVERALNRTRNATREQARTQTELARGRLIEQRIQTEVQRTRRATASATTAEIRLEAARVAAAAGRTRAEEAERIRARRRRLEAEADARRAEADAARARTQAGQSVRRGGTFLGRLPDGSQGPIITPVPDQQGPSRQAIQRTRQLSNLTRQAAERSRSLDRNFRLFDGTVARSIISVTALAAVFGTLQGIRAGTAFADQLERAQFQIAGLIASTGRLVDANGRIIAPVQAYPQLLGEARDQVGLLQRDAETTSASFAELLDNFQIALGPGLAAGLDVTQVRELTVQISQAATALGVEQRQLAEEVRSLFTGNIRQQNSRIAVALGITPEDIRQARQSVGGLDAFLRERLSGITRAAGDVERTLAVAFSNLGDLILRSTGVAFEPFRQQLLRLRDTIAATFEGDGVGNQFVALLGAGLERAAALLNSFILSLDADQVAEFFNAVGALGEQIAEIAGAALPGLLTGLQVLATLGQGVAAVFSLITSNPIGQFLITTGVAAAVLARSILALRTAVLAARTAALLLTSVIPGLGQAAAIAAIATGAAVIGAVALQDEALDAADNISSIQDALEEASNGSAQFFSQSIDATNEFSQALQRAEDQIRQLQVRTRAGLAEAGTDSNFNSVLSDRFATGRNDGVRQLRDTTLQAAAARSAVGELREEFNRLQDSENFDRSVLRDFLESNRNIIGLDTSGDAADLRAQVERSAEAAQAAFERLNAAQEVSTAAEARRRDVQAQVLQQTRQLAEAEAQGLLAVQPLLARQSQLREDALQSQIRAARLTFAAGTGLQGSDQAGLDRRIAQEERSLQVEEERRTIAGLTARARFFESQGLEDAAAAAIQLRDRALEEFRARQELFRITDQIALRDQFRLSVQERLSRLTQRQAIEAERVNRATATIEAAAAAGTLVERQNAALRAQELRIGFEQRSLLNTQRQLATARLLGENQNEINRLLLQEEQAKTRLQASTQRLLDLERQRREENEVGAGIGAGLRNFQQGDGQIAAAATTQILNDFQNSLGQGIAALFDPDQNLDLRGGIQALGRSILQTLSQAFAQAITQRLVSGILGAFFGGPAGGTSFFGGENSVFAQSGIFGNNSGGVIPGFDQGGAVGAPNVSKAPAGLHPSDRVIAALTPGEGVLNRGAMSVLGTDWLNSMNRDFGKIRVGGPRRSGNGLHGFNSGGVIPGGSPGRRGRMGRGGSTVPILVMDRERAREIMRGRAFDERAVRSRRTLNAIK